MLTYRPSSMTAMTVLKATVWAHLPTKAASGTCITRTRFVEWQEMGDIFNLRRARKNAQRRAAEQKAAANRLLHGQSKPKREVEAARNTKARRELELHRIGKADE